MRWRPQRFSGYIKLYETKWKTRQSWLFTIPLVTTIMFSNLAFGKEGSQFFSSPSSETAHSMLDVQIPNAYSGSSWNIPLYTNGNVHYFSTGVGIEERRVRYPAFPIKFILVEGKRAYTTGATLTLSNDLGNVNVSIPKEHVEGPWVFVKAPPGSYTVTASYGNHPDVIRHVQIYEQKPSTIYLRWSSSVINERK